MDMFYEKYNQDRTVVPYCTWLHNRGFFKAELDSNGDVEFWVVTEKAKRFVEGG
jgi:hypothetical protein